MNDESGGRRAAKGDKLFKQDKNPQYNVELDFARFSGIENLYATGFKAIADLGVETFRTSRDFKYRGGWLFPIAFLYRHYLELQLKNILLAAKKLGLVAQASTGDHDLATLWRETRLAFVAANWNDPDELDAVEAVILDMDRADHSSQEFRYPTTKGGKSSLGDAPDKISIVNMQETIEGVATILDDFYSYLLSELD